MTPIKSISGIMWAADILGGRREFPTFNKEDPDTAADTPDTGAEFEKVFKNACAVERAKRSRYTAAGAAGVK